MDAVHTIVVSVVPTPIVAYALLILGLGAPLMKSARWDVAFQRTAMLEIHRRRLAADRLCMEDFSSATSIVGNKELDDCVDKIASDHFAAVVAIVGGHRITAETLFAP
ncbi:hypothetical protein JVX90_01750 [Gordonia sp. PDNC005]|uniref:hypothetical protein n=1 Tax=unclassified Gordonia (in: high G+C Gram-positive bacteria) TaxID=2657482 RepID=UPI001962E94E|nr:hypothetical protein [Gordonia sp. PDNC005]QRY63003.1 hypothetical protein JVX90_01750 [Gordonia sp. PDNC005]